MKVAIVYCRFLILVLLLFAMAVIASCARKPQPTVESNHDSISNTSSNVYFKKELEKSLAIKDTFRYGFPKITTGATKVQDCDSLCNQKIKEALANVNTSKQSGNNGYKLYYDKYTNQLVFISSLQETINNTTDSIAKLNQTIKDTKSTTITIKIPVVQPLTKTQLFLQITGILFWLLLVAVIGWKIYQKYKSIKPF